MIVKWNSTFEIELIDSFDEEMDNIGESHCETVREGEIEEIDIIDDKEDCVDIQFGCGSMAFCVQKSSFEIVED